MCAVAAYGNDACKQLQSSALDASKLQIREHAILHTSFSERMICHMKRSPAFGQHKCKTTCEEISHCFFTNKRKGDDGELCECFPGTSISVMPNTWPCCITGDYNH